MTRNPELMNAGKFRAAMAELDLRVKDLPFGPDTVTKLRRGYTNITLETMIEVGQFLGIRPKIVWEPIKQEKEAEEQLKEAA